MTTVHKQLLTSRYNAIRNSPDSSNSGRLTADEMCEELSASHLHIHSITPAHTADQVSFRKLSN